MDQIYLAEVNIIFYNAPYLKQWGRSPKRNHERNYSSNYAQSTQLKGFGKKNSFEDQISIGISS